MGRKQQKYPWSGLPVGAQQRLFKFVLVGTGVLFFSVFVGMTLLTASLGKKIDEAKAQYGLVVPIVQSIEALRSRQGDLVKLPPQKAVIRILEDRALEDYIVSMRPTRIKENQEGVQLTLGGLTLIMLTDFLEDVRDRASLQTLEFTLTRNEADPRLADMHLVMAR